MVDYNHPEVIKYQNVLLARFDYWSQHWTKDQKAAASALLFIGLPEELSDEEKTAMEDYVKEWGGDDPLIIPAKEKAAEMKDLDLHTYTVIQEEVRRRNWSLSTILEDILKSRVIGLPEQHNNVYFHKLTWNNGVTTCSVKECEVNGR